MTQSSAASIVDYEHLKVQAAEDIGVMREVLELFVVHCGQVLDELSRTTDRTEWKQLTHTLKGSARGVGAFAVADAAADAEPCPLDQAHVRRISEAFEQARAFIVRNPL